MNKTFWWRNRIGYVIYPESFSDSNDDGIGDIPGIIGKLDYLKGLGVGLLWICPLYASPRVDSGYDVADYYHVDPSFGTDEDFKTLIEEAHKRDIRLILDLPLNHTSKEHAWFKKAIADPQSEERGYYLIRPGKKDEDGHLLPPNNWKGFFHESVWTRIPGTEDFYFHLFDASMPDVDWNNPKLREEYHKIAEHYLKLGIDGFRLDVVSHLDKDISFEDAKGTADNDGLVFDPSKFSHRPSVFGFLREFKEKVFSRYDCLTIGELGAISPEEAARYADRYNGVVDMVFNFDACWLNGSYDAIGKKDEEIRLDVKHLKHNLIRWYNTCHDKCEMPLFWELHDQPRVLSQYGSTQYRDESAKALFACLLFLYGTPFVYYGDEIGMSNLP
ncbi:MAG: glucohydrolase, partial [Bacilli bacterium]|nr:glucohydrolase [Bacilli bacterium]